MVPLAYIDYELRRDYISEILCINKEDPASGCEGKCFLMKRLKQTKQSMPSESPQPERFQLTFFNQIDRNTNTTLECLEINLSFETGPVSNTITYIGDIFHPPRSILYFC